MDNSQQLYGYWRDQHSFFDDLVTMLMTLSSYMFTLHCTISSNNPREFSERTLQEWISYIRPLKDFEFPFTLEASLQKIISCVLSCSDNPSHRFEWDGQM